MANFDISIPKVLAWEGGYVNHPADPGGETNRGITDKLDGKVDHLVDLDGDGHGDVDIKHLTEEQARKVYKRVFWDRIKGDEIHSQAIADILFDGFVNQGVSAIRIIQNLVFVPADGNIGPATLKAINEADERTLYNDYKSERENYYLNLVKRKPELNVFLKGWLNRIRSFKNL